MGKFEEAVPYRRTAQSQRRKLKERKGIRLWLMIGLEIVVLLALLIGVLVLINRSPVEGNWYSKDKLVYKFGKRGNGVQVMDDGLARFHYDIKDNTLLIDYDSDEYQDRTYQFSVEDDTLHLDDGINGVFTRTK